jgi:putative phage-type endonuclease
MSYRAKNVGIDQGTDEWLAWRSKGITSTAAATLMGNDPYSSLIDLWEIKTGQKQADFVVNDAMQHGIDTEPIARKILERHIGEKLDPACFELVKYPHIKTSLDGINSDNDIVAEIKCTKKDFRYLQLSSKIPNYYYCQMQHHLLASQADVCCFFPFLNINTFKFIEIYPDKDFHAELLKRSLLFKEYMDNKERPDMRFFDTYPIHEGDLKVKK